MLQICFAKESQVWVAIHENGHIKNGFYTWSFWEGEVTRPQYASWIEPYAFLVKRLIRLVAPSCLQLLSLIDRSFKQRVFPAVGSSQLAGLLVQRSLLVMPGSPFFRVGYWDLPVEHRFPGLGRPHRVRESTLVLAHTPRNIHNLRNWNRQLEL